MFKGCNMSKGKLMNYDHFLNRAIGEYKQAVKAIPMCLTLEQLEKRFFKYIKLNFLFAYLLPHFIYNKWRLKWWRRTLVEVIMFFPQWNITVGEACSLLVEKNKCYGNNGLHSLGTLGIAIRSMDKIYRVMNIQKNSHLKSTQLYQEEGIQDSIMDLGNYCVLAILLCEGVLD